MCLIVVKPKGKNLPTKKQLKQWFDGHSDGFGLAYPFGEGKVRIRKGAMTKRAMLKVVRQMRQDLRGVGVSNVNVMFHFRQATNGEVAPANCHPFPLTKNQEELAATQVDTECAIAHNGIVGTHSIPYYYDGACDYSLAWMYVQGKTDTQEFIEEYLVDLGETIHLPAVQKLIGAYSASKFALMTAAGVEYIGEFVKEEGWYYSNSGYKPPLVSAHPINYSYWEGNTYLCDGCQEWTEKLYRIPKDYSLVCANCFTYFVGRKPEEGEKMDDYSYTEGGEQWL